MGAFGVRDSNGSFQETALFEGLVIPRELRVEGKEKSFFFKWIVRNQSLNTNEQEDTMLQQRKGGAEDNETQV